MWQKLGSRFGILFSRKTSASMQRLVYWSEADFKYQQQVSMSGVTVPANASSSKAMKARRTLKQCLSGK